MIRISLCELHKSCVGKLWAGGIASCNLKSIRVFEGKRCAFYYCNHKIYFSLKRPHRFYYAIDHLFLKQIKTPCQTADLRFLLLGQRHGIVTLISRRVLAPLSMVVKDHLLTFVPRRFVTIVLDKQRSKITTSLEAIVRSDEPKLSFVSAEPFYDTSHFNDIWCITL